MFEAIFARRSNLGQTWRNLDRIRTPAREHFSRFLSGGPSGGTLEGMFQVFFRDFPTAREGIFVLPVLHNCRRIEIEGVGVILGHLHGQGIEAAIDVPQSEWPLPIAAPPATSALQRAAAPRGPAVAAGIGGSTNGRKMRGTCPMGIQPEDRKAATRSPGRPRSAFTGIHRKIISMARSCTRHARPEGHRTLAKRPPSRECFFCYRTKIKFNRFLSEMDQTWTLQYPDFFI